MVLSCRSKCRRASKQEANHLIRSGNTYHTHLIGCRKNCSTWITGAVGFDSEPHVSCWAIITNYNYIHKWAEACGVYLESLCDLVCWCACQHSKGSLCIRSNKSLILKIILRLVQEQVLSPITGLADRVDFVPRAR